MGGTEERSKDTVSFLEILIFKQRNGRMANQVLGCVGCPAWSGRTHLLARLFPTHDNTLSSLFA
jgi:hypothetical protein